MVVWYLSYCVSLDSQTVITPASCYCSGPQGVMRTPGQPQHSSDHGRAGLRGAGDQPCGCITGVGAPAPGTEMGPWAIGRVGWVQEGLQGLLMLPGPGTLLQTGQVTSPFFTSFLLCRVVKTDLSPIYQYYKYCIARKLLLSYSPRLNSRSADAAAAQLLIMGLPRRFC